MHTPFIIFNRKHLNIAGYGFCNDYFLNLAFFCYEYFKVKVHFWFRMGYDDFDSDSGATGERRYNASSSQYNKPPSYQKSSFGKVIDDF